MKVRNKIIQLPKKEQNQVVQDKLGIGQFFKSKKAQEGMFRIDENQVKSCKDKRTKSQDKKPKYQLKLPRIKSKKKQQKIRNSISRAFFVKQLEYTPRLVYDKVKEHQNDASLESPKVQDLSLYDNKILETIQNQLPPVYLSHDQTTGYFVKAAQNIPELTLICEYIGEVQTWSHTIGSKNDSIMQLLVTKDPETSLVIVPQKYANIARFFNGINNSLGKSETGKINLKTMRCQVKKLDPQAKPGVRVLIYASRHIQKGEIMLFDYNSGQIQKDGRMLYNTSFFI